MPHTGYEITVTMPSGQRDQYPSMRAAEKALGIGINTISKHINGVTAKHRKGYTFELVIEGGNPQ